MPKKRSITFRELADDESPLTKFGGQPRWVAEPQWPIGKELGKPMRFLCQIELADDLFPEASGKVAYIFMTDDEEYVDGTWEPFGGENAVIIQPGGKTDIPCKPLTTGPTLQNYVNVEGFDRLQPRDVEFGLSFVDGEDPHFVSEFDRIDSSEEEGKMYRSIINGNKIGGTPGFLQGDEFPDETHDWRLLLQLDSCAQPFSVNFGDSGIAYAFVTPDGTEGRFLWQCC
jgi:uncharacterized protein YwqG